MDAKNAFEAIEAIRNTVPPDELPILDAKLTARFGALSHSAGHLAVTETQATVPTPERLVLTAESLLETFDTAYQTYSWQMNTANAARAEAKGRKKPVQLETVTADTIRTDLEAVLANGNVVADLQAELDYFAANAEADSPVPGFDVVVLPEGLTASDNQELANSLQARIQGELGTSYGTPYIRPEVYNDKRTPVITGKGYRIAFAPRHYNVPSGTASAQKTWLEAHNRGTTATELQTATDAEAMGQINNLLTNDMLSKGSGHDRNRFHQTHWRRSDQAPLGLFVSDVYVGGLGKLLLGGSYARDDEPARALVVPKA